MGARRLVVRGLTVLVRTASVDNYQSGIRYPAGYGGRPGHLHEGGYSVQYAPNVVDKVWSTAANLGYGRYFPSEKRGYITDDHLPVNQHKRAPSVNIINLKQDTRTGFVLTGIRSETICEI